MKKIFILPMLIAPIMAYATDPVGPAHVNSGAVVATANAPYATAGAETGDTTNVVSASYVKGAYNDAIAAINNVAADVNSFYDSLDDKQGKLVVSETENEISNDVVNDVSFKEYIVDVVRDGLDSAGDLGYNTLVTADGVAQGMAEMLKWNGVKAVTVWGSDNETVLSFSYNQQ